MAMDKTTIDIIGGIIFISLGLWFTTCFKNVGSEAVRYQQKLWSFLTRRPVNFSEGTIKFYKIGYLVVGILFIAFGLLTIFKII